MRILIVNYEYPPLGGGGGTASKGLASGLSALGHSVSVLTTGFGDLAARSEENGVVVYRVRSGRSVVHQSNVWEMMLFLMCALVRAPKLVQREKIEGLIVFFSIPCGPIGLACHWASGTPYIVSLRGGDVPGTEPSLRWLHQLLAPLRRAVLRSAVAVTTNSEGLAKRAGDADAVPVRVIPNGVDTHFFTPAAPRQPDELLRVLFVGRLQKQKNVSFLLEEMARIGPLGFHLDVVGDGPERAELQRLVETLGLAKAVTWHGWLGRNELRARYQAADCLVNLSLYEGMSNAIMEAMACALPVVASAVTGNNDLVQNERTGLLFELDRPGAFADALQRIRENPSFARELGLSARQYVQNEFSWQRTAQAYRDLLIRKKLP